MNSIKNIFKKKSLLVFTALIFVFLVSLVFFITNVSGRYYNFSFYISGTDTLVQENRRVYSIKDKNRLNGYVGELLLGTTVKRASPIFPLGTKALFCFQRNDTLYLNLSQDALFNLENSLSLTKRINLLEKNIRKNFPSIKNVELFIDGNYIQKENS